MDTYRTQYSYGDLLNRFSALPNNVYLDNMPEEVSSAIAAKVHAVDPEANVSALALGTDGRTVRLTTNYRIDDNADGIDEQVEHFIYEGLKEHNLIKADYATFIDRDNHKGGSIISSQKSAPRWLRT